MTLLLAIIGHLVGDYVLQRDAMAVGKKSSSWICAWHCLLWTTAVCTFAGWYYPWAILTLFATHFAQDRTRVVEWWMRLNGQAGFMQPPLAPWSLIVVDNVWHIVTLYLVWRFLTPGH